MDTFVSTGMTSGPRAADEDRTINVPLNRKPLAPMPRERVRRIRVHLVRALRDLRTMKKPEQYASPPRPEPGGFAGVVARSGCALCAGFCCKGGGEHAYLDERDMARVRQARPELEARSVIRLYIERVPEETYEGSCVFHGPRGCALDRSLRSDVCNSYFCNALRDFVANESSTNSVVVVAGSGEAVRTSGQLMR